MSADARREQFVRAAIEVMSREGLSRATTRRIAEQAGAPQAAVHYAFRDKNELFAAVVGEITTEIERVLRAAVDPTMELTEAIKAGVTAFWSHVVGDDGLQLMQYELAIFSRRTPGLEWLAQWQYTRYTAVVSDVFATAARSSGVDIDALARFLVAAVDGLILQYEVHHDAQRAEIDLANAIRATLALAAPAQ